MTDTNETDPIGLDVAGRRRLAADLYNRTWTLLQLTEPTAVQTDELIHAAHASRFHWGEVVAAGGGEPANLARGEWLCSRMYAVLGRAEPALWHARRCVEIDEAAGIGDWDLASAYEAMARALTVAGDGAAAREWVARARAACAGIAEEDDREVIEGDLATLGLD